MSQARCSVHSSMKASGTDGPQVSRPWLRRMTARLVPMSRTMRSFSAASTVTPSKSW